MGHIYSLISGPNVAFTTRSSSGSHLFWLGLEDAHGAGSLPETAHSVPYLGTVTPGLIAVGNDGNDKQPSPNMESRFSAQAGYNILFLEITSRSMLFYSFCA